MCQTDFFASAVVTIGFNTVAYSVLEDAGSVNVTVSVLNGTLARNIEVTLSTVSDSTATGELVTLAINTHYLTSENILSFLPLQLEQNTLIQLSP